MTDDGRLDDYLSHLRQAAHDALAFIDGMTQDAFLADRRTQAAVIMSLIVIGEAAAQIMDRHPAFVQQHPQVPWRSMRGMRNRMAHGYFETDLQIVWETVTAALPGLLKQLAETPDNQTGAAQ